MTTTLETRVEALELLVKKQSAHIKALDDRIDNDWAVAAIKAHNPDEETISSSVVDDIVLNGTHPIKAYRKHRLLSQELLGQMIGSSKAYISQLETGTRNAGPKTLVKLAEALSVDVDQLT